MYRLRAFLKGLGKLILAAAILAALYGGWRAFLRWGPGWMHRGSAAPPAMFVFHAKQLLKPVESLEGPELFLPQPQPLSSQDMQLKLMKWRDARGWLPAALALGEPTKQGLRLRSGRLVLDQILSVGPIQVQGQATKCQVNLRVRWELAESLQEIHRVRELVGLRMPKDLVPGQTSALTCTFVQSGWSWELLKTEPEWPGRSKRNPRLDGVAGWFF